MVGFSEQVAGFCSKTGANLNDVVAESVKEAGRRLIDRSPAPEKGNPYSTGRFISNWRYGLETPDQHFSPATGLRTVNDIADLPRKAGGFIHWITNSAPYGHYLEYGTSKMAPQPMVGLTVVEWPQIVRQATAKVLGRSSSATYQGGEP